MIRRVSGYIVGIVFRIFHDVNFSAEENVLLYRMNIFAFSFATKV